MISETLEKQKKDADPSNSQLPLNPKRVIKPIIMHKIVFEPRVRIIKCSIKRPKARFWEFKGICSRTDNIKNVKKLTSAMKSSKNIRRFTFDYPQPNSADWAEIHGVSSITYAERNCLLKYVSRCVRGQRPIKQASFNFQGFWADTKVNTMGMYLLRRILKSLVSIRSLKLDCAKHPDITENRAKKFSQTLKTLGLLQEISLNFHWNDETSDKGVENLAKDLKKATGLQKIDIEFPSCKKITGTGFQNFGQILNDLPSLQTAQLDLSSCSEIHDEGMHCIGQGIKAISSLRNLKLKFQCSYEITEKGFTDLAKGIQELPLLKNLDLSFWILPIKKFDFSFAKLNSLQSLKLVLFACRELVDLQLFELQESLKGLSSLQKIDLRFVECRGLTDASLDRLGLELPALASLQDITTYFYNCNKFTDEGVENYSKNLKNLNSLTSLKLAFEGCDQLTDAGLCFLSENLEALSSLKTLQLNFSSPNYTPGGIITLAESWVQLPLENIELQFTQDGNANALNDEVIEELGRSLNQIASLQSIILEIGQGECVTKAGENSFFQALSGHQCLKSTQFKTSHPNDIE